MPLRKTCSGVHAQHVSKWDWLADLQCIVMCAVSRLALRVHVACGSAEAFITLCILNLFAASAAIFSCSNAVSRRNPASHQVCSKFSVSLPPHLQKTLVVRGGSRFSLRPCNRPANVGPYVALHSFARAGLSVIGPGSSLAVGQNEGCSPFASCLHIRIPLRDR